ncbi:GCN5-like N-acetyltransferase [Salinarchaeum sp. Harcht-Bsk1]|uniref:GNAT family N-acetyltransferase n=1 Tax=Salinarchaeum sp. Harcht-Bsk1 TaxID=1333523 RepID=UPI00034241CA|nr:GNAT family N-acetyltransferase [Salinarchaeum sp. Harcht-Bsk1]AGN02944.1 GCN5-like N-acetyltransferase [Salinarchaeum sp. Harcht-Bsk1]
MRIREAAAGDGDVIGSVHERSVRQLAADAYDDAVVEAWVTLPDDDSGDTDDQADDVDDEGEDTDETDGADDAADESDTHADDSVGVQPDDGRLFVAEVPADDGAGARMIAGFGDVRFEPPEYLDEPADGGIRAVYVDPDHAGEGVGSALLRRLEVEARDEGLDSLGFLASVNARGFYERHGYEAISERRFDFGDGVEGPAVEMRRELDANRE